MKKILNLLTALVMAISLIGVIPVVNVCGETTNPTTGLSTTVSPTTVVKPSLVTRPTIIKPTTPKKRTVVTKVKTNIKASENNLTEDEIKGIFKTVKIKKFRASSRNNRILMCWETIKNATGYQIQVAKDKKLKKIIKTTYLKNLTSDFINGLSFMKPDSINGTMIKKKYQTGKKYYIRVRPYIKASNKKKVYGEWTKAKRIKIVKSKIESHFTQWLDDDDIHIKFTTYEDKYGNLWTSYGYFDDAPTVSKSKANKIKNTQVVKKLVVKSKSVNNVYNKKLFYNKRLLIKWKQYKNAIGYEMQTSYSDFSHDASYTNTYSFRQIEFPLEITSSDKENSTKKYCWVRVRAKCLIKTKKGYSYVYSKWTKSKKIKIKR